MILNHCRGCGCPLDPGERYCEECEEKLLEPETSNRGMMAIKKDKKRRKVNANDRSMF